MGSRGRKGTAWWRALSPEKRAELKRRQASARPTHHFRDDLACPACGTDSTVGCFATPKGAT